MEQKFGNKNIESSALVNFCGITLKIGFPQNVHKIVILSNFMAKVEQVRRCKIIRQC